MDGHDAVLFAYGPVMLNEAMTAAETLQRTRFVAEGYRFALAESH